MSLIVEKDEFTALLRLMGTNVLGQNSVMYSITKIRGIGRRMAGVIVKKAEVDMRKRAGELTDDEVESLQAVMTNPLQFDIPTWFLNRRKDRQTGKDLHLIANHLDGKLREDIERMKKIRLHRGLRHAWKIRVRGQHTKTTGRRGRTLAINMAKSN